MSKASEAGREILSPGERYLHDELEAMREENAAAHTQISLNIAKHVGELRKDTDDRFDAVDKRFDAVEATLTDIVERLITIKRGVLSRP